MELFFVKHHSKPNYYKHAHTLCLIITIFLLRSPLLVSAQYFGGHHRHHDNSDRNSNPLYLGMAFAAATTFIIVIFITVNIYCKSSPASQVRADDGLVRRASAGLDPSVVETFPVFKYSEVAAHRVDTGLLECAVCLSPFEADDDEKLRLLPKCNHVFHVSCVDPWLKDHSTCPVCRADLAPASDDLTQPDTGQAPESGGTSREAAEVNDDNVLEVRGDIEEGQVGKIYKRWKSTGHVAQLERVNEDNWKRFTLKLSEERMKKLGEKSSKFKRTRSSF